MKKRLWIVALAATLLITGLIGWGRAAAKTSPGGQTVDTVLFYVENSGGDDILVSQLPVSRMDEDLEDGLIDDTVYNYSLLDNYVTTVHQEAQGFTVAEFIDYAQGYATLPVLQALALSFSGDDTVGLWTIDKTELTETWSYNYLYGVTRYNYPQLYEYWNYTAQNYYDPSGAKTREQVLAYLQANAQTAQFRLAVQSFSQRYIDTDVNGFNMENLWSSRDLLDTGRAVRAMKPMTAQELLDKDPTANDSRYWIWYVLLSMEDAPDLESLGEVAAPSGYLTEDNDNYYVHFYCATPGATIYYNHNYQSASYMPTAPYDPNHPLAIAKSALSSGQLAINAHAVKEGYSDAGVVRLTLSVGADCPQVSAGQGYIAGQDMVLPVSNSDVGFSEWAAGLTVRVNGTQLNPEQYTLSTASLTIDGSVVGAAGTYHIVLASEGFSTQTLQGVAVYYAAPAVSVLPGYYGQDLVFAFADDSYQSQATLMVKPDRPDAAYAGISASNLYRGVAGRLTVAASYFGLENTKVPEPGNYVFKITNANYWPMDQEIHVTLAEEPYSRIIVSNVAAGPGETVNVPVSVSDNLGFAGFTFVLSYDSKLTLNSITKGSGSILTNESGSFLANPAAKRVAWADSESTVANGQLFVANFTVSETAAPGEKLDISLSLLDNKAKNFADANGQAVNVRFISGGVTLPGTIWDGATADTRWYDTESASFTLDNPAELAGLAAIVNGTAEGIARDDFSNKTVALGADLDLGGCAWTPIGMLTVQESGNSVSVAEYYAFNGCFEGREHRIESLSIESGASGQALFACLGEDGTIRDLTVEGSVSGNYYVAGIVSYNLGQLEGLVNRVTVSAANSYVGGVAAECGGTAFAVTDCHNLAPVSNSSYTQHSGKVAGIVGQVDTGAVGVISCCSNMAEIYGYQYVGGVIGGQFGDVDVEYCYNTGDLTGVSFGKVYLGGIAGMSEGGSIANCYNTGNLTNLHWFSGHVRAMGGISGCEEGRAGFSVAISNCYTTGAITINTDNMIYGTNWIYEIGNISGGNSPTSHNTMLYENCFYLEGRIALADPEHESYRFWADVYKADRLIWDTPYIAAKTEAELKEAGTGEDDILTLLGAAFTADTEGVNEGYPILAWQVGQEILEVEYHLAASCYPAGEAQVTLSAAKAYAGTAVTVTVSEIIAGRQVRSVQALDAAGNALTVTATGNGVYSFTMPKRAVTVTVTLENTVPESAAAYNVTLPTDLDAIWSLSADSTYRDAATGQIKAGATVYLTVNKAPEAAMTSLEGIQLMSSGVDVPYTPYTFKRDSGGAGYQGVYIFTMPAAPVNVSLNITYGDFKVYTQTGSGEKHLVKTYSRGDMLALASANLYYSGYASETEAFIGKAEQAVTLGALLSDAGLTFGAGQRIEVTAADGMNLYYTHDKLYGSPRYYYPNLISGADAAAKAAGRTPVDSMFVIKGYMAAESEGDVEEHICDTLYAYRFVYSQNETEFNNGVPAVEYKAISYFPKYANSLTLITPEEGPFEFDWDDAWDWDTENYYDISWYNRTDTAFHLATNMQLAGLAWIVNQGNTLQLPGESAPLQEAFTEKTIYLDVDILLNNHNVSGTANDTIGDIHAHQWPSIAGSTASNEKGAVFNGTFDGQGHTISNLYIFDLSYWEYYYDGHNRGLFGITAEQAIIKNVTVKDGFVRAARSTGAVVGKTGTLNPNQFNGSLADGHGTIIENCHNVNTTVITTDSKGVGGIVGSCWNYPIVRSCSNSGAISSTGAWPAGGIAGENEGTIGRCFNTGNISSAGDNAGGIVGSNKLPISAINDCYNSGAITGAYAGGITGYQVGSAQNCYNIGSIGGTYAGGMFGELKSSQTNSGLYYLNTACAAGVGRLTSGTDSTAAKTMAELKSAAMVTLLGSAWRADSATAPINSGYPVLSWQLPAPAVKYGDLNGDNKINITDTILLRQYQVRLVTFTEAQFVAGDLNGDDKINITDTILLRQYQVKLISRFPVESP